MAKLFPALTFAILLLGVEQANSQNHSVTFAWNRNWERDIAGYRLYYGTAPGNYTERLDVGNLVTATVLDLTGGVVYHFAVTAYNTAGIESSFSNEVIYAAPAGTPPPNPTPGPSMAPTIVVLPSSLNFSVVVGGSDPAPQNLQVTTSTGVPWSSFTTSGWFKAEPVAGPSGGFNVVTVQASGLGEGTYVDEIKFSAPGFPDNQVFVTLSVMPEPSPGIVRDDFNRPDDGLGPNWIMDASWGSGLVISDNKVVAPSSGGVYWIANTFAPDQYSQIRLTGTIDKWSGAIVRGNLRPAPFYLARVSDGGVDLYAWLSGTLVRLGHDSTLWTTGDILRLAVRNLGETTAHLTVYRNGVEVFSYDHVDSPITSGRPGIGLRSAVPGMSLDDWEGGGVVP